MAANPLPFQVEDNSDEDFFDKLVDDDDTTFTPLPPVFTESDDVKAFANLSINEDVSNSKESGNSSNLFQFNNVKVESVDGSGNVLPSINSFEFEKLVQENESGSAGGLSDATVVSKTSSECLSDTITTTPLVTNNGVGSGALGVKEVDWSAFHAEMGQPDSNGFGSYSDFFSEIEGVNAADPFENIATDNTNSSFNVPQVVSSDASAPVENSISYAQNDNGQNNGVTADQVADTDYLNSSEYWESQYPGWKYDPNTGQWYQVDTSGMGTGLLSSTDATQTSTWGVSDGVTEASYLQQSVQSATGTVAEAGTVQSVTNWNQASQVIDPAEAAKDWNQVSQVSGDVTGAQSEWNQASQDNNGYPQHMVFDPQYPGWYYDTIAQEWRSLESYVAQSTAQIQDQTNHTEYVATDMYSQNNNQTNNNQTTYNAYSQGNNYRSQNWDGVGNSYNQQTSTWQPDSVSRHESTPLFNGNHVQESHHAQSFSGTAESKQNPSHSYYQNINQVQSSFSVPAQLRGSAVGYNSTQHRNDSRINQNEHKHNSYIDYNDQNSFTFPQQQHQNGPRSHVHTHNRSSAGRPAHSLVAFGFGGKLIVMKHDGASDNMSFGSQNVIGKSLSVLNLAEVVSSNVDASNHGVGACNYFQALGRQSVPGPLTGGSVGTKELSKWIDERIANPTSLDVDYRKAEVLRLLLSLLKIACQYYGKLRSPYGSDGASKESDGPESAVAKLFATAKGNASQFSQYGSQCLQQMPSEGQIQAAAMEVQRLLVSGNKREALQCAQEGQLWGPALVLAAQLGDQYYVETVKLMALHQLVAGSPLRTLCLLIAGQPADVFAADTSGNSVPGYANIPQQQAQIGGNGMLDDWEENLAVITANRTKDDELVLMHLGDCLWKERSNIIAAHICYLVAEASFEPYSDTARLCLVGADHWKFPRTYASPGAIQRTEIYEYSKTLGNSQFVLLPFQPYKLVYAYMLAEVGRISDALKYTRAVLKSLKTSRNPEVENLKHLASALEERIKTHQQGGFSTTLAPSKLVGKLLNLFDTTASRVVGSLPPPVPTQGGHMQVTDNHHQPAPRVSTSQSTLAMSTLMPSQSTERINEWASDGNIVAKHTRSVSEPDFGRTPRQGQTDSGKEASSTEGKAATSRLGRFSFGSQLLQKTVGLVLKPRQGKQAKLGDSNKFYYDEKLKRWVEEGAEAPAEEAALPPPPPTAVFQNGTSDYNLKSALQTEASHSNGSPEYKSPGPMDGMPPLPPITNQYSARGRMGVRSRYVDTFNKGGGGNSANLFQSPSVPTAKQTSAAKPTFFMPTQLSSTPEQPADAPFDNSMLQAPPSTNQNPSSPNEPPQFQTPSATMQRFASMNHISNKEMRDNNSFSTNSRRTASWGGFNNSFSPPHRGEVKQLGEVLGIDPSSLMTNEDLQEVEL